VGGDIRITKELRVSPSDLSELIISLGGVKFWIVAMVPLYIGWVLAQPPATRHLFIDDARLILALLAIGPFLSTFTLLINTYYDMGSTDRLNPRKKYVQVVEELIDPGTLLWAAAGFAGLGLLLSWYVSSTFVSYADPGSGPVTGVLGTYGFSLVMTLVVLLGVAYSHPAIRWKGVAGMDLATNMVGFGILCPLGGWVLLQPLESAPWWYIGTITLFLGAVYAPTTASDFEADRATGIRTLAVRLGVNRTLLLGFLLQIASVVSLGWGWSQRWFPFDVPGAHDAMGRLWPFVALQIVFYAVFIRKPTVGKIWALLLLLSIAEGIGVLLMLWGFVQGRALSP
jgi:4-hydroxybenzoate polyprenyltransferase